MNNELAKTLADYVINRLSSLGLKHIFYLPGGGCMYLIDAIAKSNKLQGIALLHEQSVGIAAEAYSQFTNELSACVVTTGPGATNAITPCAAAWTDSTPVLFISGQVKTGDSADKFGVRQLGFQEIPITQIVKPITKLAIKLDYSMDIDEVLSRLISEALKGRPGPVWLDIPLDLQSSLVNLPMATTPLEINSDELKLSKQSLLEMIDVWSKAKRPILMVGNGVRLANQQDVVRKIMSITCTPALLTWKMIDFLDERDNLNAGRPGTAGQRWANLAQQNCDFILCLGSRLDIGQTAYRLDNFAPNASKYICEIDEMEIRKLPKSFKSFHAPLNNFLFELHALLEKHYQTRNQGLGWTNKIQLLKEKFPLIPSHKVTMKNGVNLYHFIEELSNTMDPNDILVPGSSGACSEVVMQAFKVKDGQRILNSEGLGPMGFGLPAAIGVAFANDKKNRIISIDGDGGFLMNIQELVTLKYHNLPIVIFVLNNSGYGSIRSTQISYFDGRLMGTDPTSGLGLPNWNSLIEGFGLNHFYIQDYKSMKEILFNLKRISLPCVIEVLIEKNQITEPRVASTRLLSGEFKTDDMANMSPKLTLTEFENLKSFLVD